MEGVDALFLDQNGWPQFVEAHYAKRIDFMRAERKEKLEQALLERDSVLTQLEKARLRGSSEYAEKDREFAKLKRFSERLLSRNTREPFDENTRYQNPYLERQHKKDLHLARRWIAGSNFAEPYVVMVGDTSDKGVNVSDPSTPVVVVSDAVRRGNWVLVENILDVLLHSAVEEPLKVYDCLYRASSSLGDRRSVAVEGIHYVFEVETFEGVTSRRVYCP